MTTKRTMVSRSGSGGSEEGDLDAPVQKKRGKEDHPKVKSSTPSDASADNSEHKEVKAPSVKKEKKEVKEDPDPVPPAEMLNFINLAKSIEKDYELDLDKKSAGVHFATVFKDIQMDDKNIDLKAIQFWLRHVYKEATKMSVVTMHDFLQTCGEYLERGEAISFHPAFPDKGLDLGRYVVYLKAFKEDHKNILQPKQSLYIDQQITKTEKEIAAKKTKAKGGKGKSKKKKDEEELKPKTPFEIFSAAKKAKYAYISDEAKRLKAMHDDFDKLGVDEAQIYMDIAEGL